MRYVLVLVAVLLFGAYAYAIPIQFTPDNTHVSAEHDEWDIKGIASGVLDSQSQITKHVRFVVSNFVNNHQIVGDNAGLNVAYEITGVADLTGEYCTEYLGPNTWQIDFTYEPTDITLYLDNTPDANGDLSTYTDGVVFATGHVDYISGTGIMQVHSNNTATWTITYFNADTVTLNIADQNILVNGAPVDTVLAEFMLNMQYVDDVNIGQSEIVIPEHRIDGSIQFDSIPVPEPLTVVLLGIGLFTVAGALRCK